MSLTNPNTVVTEQRLSDFYQSILPYMGGLVSSKAGFTPVGTIISVMGTAAPVNYLACDGTVYNIADYVELANYFGEQFGSKNFFGGDGTTTFAVPDLRGEFLRGAGTNSHANQGSGANVGVHQDATEHLFLFKWTNNNIYCGGKEESVVPSNTDTTTMSTVGRSDVSTTASTTRGEKTYTSRPTNTSVLYCIATKNFYIDPTLDYSTDEKIVGTWVDGEPVYQKTVECGALPNSTYKFVPHGIPNFDKCLRAWGVAYNNLGSMLLPYVDDEMNTARINISADATNVFIGSRQFNGSSYTTTYITIQYTKTN